MYYLIISIILSVSIGIIFKSQNKYKVNIFGITSVSYFISALFSLYLVISSNLIKEFHLSFFNNFFKEFNDVVLNNINSFSIEGSISWAIILGSITGLIYCAGFIFFQKNIQISGIAITNIYMKGSVIIPLLFSLFIFREELKYIQYIGVLLCVFAIVFANFNIDKKPRISLNYKLFLLFVFVGLSDLSSKLFQKYALIEYKDLYLLSIFVFALLFSLIILFKNYSKIKKRDVLVGISVGIPNLFTTYFFVLALDKINMNIVYIISSASALIITLLFGKLIFKEKINKIQLIAIITAIFSVILIKL